MCPHLLEDWCILATDKGGGGGGGGGYPARVKLLLLYTFYYDAILDSV